MFSVIPESFLNACNDIDNYRNIKKIGEGVYGRVFKAEHKQTKKIVAVKLLLKLELTQVLNSAYREILILKQIKHENVIKLIDVCKAKRNNYELYTVFPLCDHDLAGLIRNSEILMSLPIIKNILFQILNGISYIHENHIMHRDLKPSNIFLSNDGVLKIGDFGLARRFKLGGSDNYTNNVVSLWYRAPELLLGAQHYNGSVDMWSVGCVFAELCQRRVIFKGHCWQKQLVLISEVCGSICPHVWPGVNELDLYKKIQLPIGLNRKLKTNLINSIRDRNGLDLLDKLLVLYPKRRIKAISAIKHNFFKFKPNQQELVKMLSSYKNSFYSTIN